MDIQHARCLPRSLDLPRINRLWWVPFGKIALQRVHF